MGEGFDFDGFHQSVDAVRQRKGLTWSKVADESGLSGSTLSRMGRGSRPDVDTVAALASWARLDLNAFVRTSSSGQDRLEVITSYIQSDPKLGRDAARILEELLQATYSRLASDTPRSSQK